MTDEVTPGQAPTDGGQEPQTQPAPIETTPVVEEKFDADYVKKLRGESADYRKKLRDAESRLAELEKASLTEQERREKRLAELEAQQADWQRERLEMLTRQALTGGAAKLGLDPDLAWRLLDPAELEYDDDGKPKNVEPVLKGMLKKWPQLAPAAGASPTNPQKGSGDEPAETAAEKRKRIFGGGPSIFDADLARRMGGGVIFPETKRP